MTPPTPVSEKILEAVARVLAVQSYAKSGLTKADADRLGDRDWRHWLPDARAALAVLTANIVTKETLTDRLMLKETDRQGTEGRKVWLLYYLPWGHDKNNQFGDVIKYGIASFSNSYDDAPLAFFRELLKP